MNALTKVRIIEIMMSSNGDEDNAGIGFR
ncbi:protein of unknown function [Shewanella benthica]|uniref:Uncharacterized protein n=1 Tax=Shewanella benthica TaxID=43661 RepID=A0A330M772_9GAMM|nr:protein of unknown function [Shewanella benthica]